VCAAGDRPVPDWANLTEVTAVAGSNIPQHCAVSQRHAQGPGAKTLKERLGNGTTAGSKANGSVAEVTENCGGAQAIAAGGELRNACRLQPRAVGDGT